MIRFAFVALLALFSAELPADPSVGCVSAHAINSGALQNRFVRLRGVLSSALRDDTDEYHNWLVVRTPEGPVCAAVAERTIPLVRLKSLCDAEVEIRGLVRRHAHWRKFLGYLLVVVESKDLSVLKAPPEDPYSAPPVGEVATAHRVTATGIVLARTRTHFFIRGNDGSFLPVKLADEGVMPRPGQRVDVAGFADPDQRNVQLSETVWRTSADDSPPVKEAVMTNAIAQLFFYEGRHMANLDSYGRIVCVSGRVTMAEDGQRHIRLQGDSDSVVVDLSGLGEDVALPEAGATVAVTGVCFADFRSDKSTMVFPKFCGFCVVPRSQADVRIVRAAPRWTAERLAAGIVVLLAILCFLAIWTVALSRALARRARELASAQVANAKTEAKIEERTNLAVDLHDAMSQTLTGVALQLEAIESAGPVAPSVRRFLSSARRMLDSCREELRGCLWDLRSRTFEEKDMTEAIVRSLRPRLGRDCLSVRFNVPRESLSEQTAHDILKIVRELVTNALRHGKARHVRVAGEWHGGLVSFAVSDDGVGFDPARAAGPSEGHFGLQGVRERLRAYGGNLSLESTVGHGTRCVVTLRLKKEEAE